MKRPLLQLAALALATLAGAATNTITNVPKAPAVLKPAPGGSRFLFVMDMSSPMKATDAANRQALFDLVFTGFDSQMRHGDTIGLWLFSDDVRVGEFPLQVWDSENPLPVASRAAQFVRAQKYSGKTRMDLLGPRLQALVRGVRDVHIILISSGEPTIEGTPFDAALKAASEKKQAERRKEQKPLITTLNVRGGQIISASVTLPGQFIELPERPLPSVVMVSTNASAPSNAMPRVASMPPRPTVPRTEVEPREPGAPATKVWTPATAAPRPTNETTVPRPQVVEIVTQTNPVTVPPRAQETSVVVTAAGQPAPPVAERPPPTPILAPDPLPVVAREDAPPALAAATPAPVYVVQPAVSPTLLLAIGATLLAACLMLLVIVLRRLRPSRHGSVITQSMDRR